MLNIGNIYDEYVDGLFNYGMKMIADRELVKDCIQDVFVKMYTKREELDLADNTKSYLYVSLRNRIMDEFRHKKYYADKEINDNIIKDVDDGDDVSAKEDMESRLSAVDGYVSHLSPRQRQIITLYYMERQKYNDICRIMGINYHSARNLLCRSLMRLRVIRTEMA